MKIRTAVLAFLASAGGFQEGEAVPVIACRSTAANITVITGGIVVFGDAHLRRILAAYAGYYNELRTHLSLSKDTPGRRPILGGLHHQYCRT